MTIRPSQIGPATLAADDFLTNPDNAALVEQIRAVSPAWLLDQFDAAGQQIARGMRAVSDSPDFTFAASPAEQHPAWIRLGALTALVTWLAGRGSTCRHSPTFATPQPLIAAAWRPDLIACSQCGHLFKLSRHDDTDRTCDGCGRVTTGIEHGDGIWPAIVQVGLLTYMLGCCRDCRYWDSP